MRSDRTVPTLEALRTCDGVELVIWCDFCKRWHRHGSGGPTMGAGNGHRVAHCGSQRSPYFRTGYVLCESGPLTRDEQYRISGRKRVRGLDASDYVCLPRALQEGPFVQVAKAP